MKTGRIITVLLLCFVLLFSATSCVTSFSQNNGKHKGWYKNSNNPHHPNTTNPGKARGNHNK
ncbi:MAG: hypothetical protein HGA37_09565 [Lentimicrobium sp.]|nr:hypothetical protein [Lentimicrobium sp.]